MDLEMKPSKEAAKFMVESALHWGKLMNQSLLDVRAKCGSDEEYRIIKRQIGGAMADLSERVIKPNIEVYPEITPPELR